jgi:hypothetical protein
MHLLGQMPHLNIFSGACTDTYYEISAWVKNICSMCGSDSTGKSGFNAGYIPTATGDSSGVRPNLAFEVNGIDYYSTGDILYQGIGGTAANSDTMNNWVRRSFIYKTSSTETNFKFTIRNNAPGGGGNDWALDDISIRTCFPNMVYSPSITPGVCAGSTMTIRDTVRSFYDTYKHYKWQRYNTITTNWDDIAGTTTTVTPVLIGGFYQFVATYVIPPTFTTVSNNGDRYRLMVATNVPNLANGCGYSDIIPIQITVNVCIDIDDDNDGIPDYVEFNNPLALGDHDNDGIPNWNDTNYPGFVDNNFDGVNDRFDWGADADNDGVANFIDTDFPGFVDSNGDNVNDNADQDLDGIINQYDLDSDNDGLPDVVESYGVDTNGDAIIDNYTDTDGDGFSQNVDANATGVAGSSSGLGAQDFDGDAIPNYLDTDSDNDGIPDIVEALNIDVDNNGRIDGFVDANNDGISDNDVNGTAKLITGPDLSPIDGRADNWPNKNIDRDARPNAYDMDSDGDGITDVLEAGLPDANLNGIVDGTIAINGWSTTISAMGSLNLRNTDGIGNPDYLDIDSDDDGIPDNIEGQSTVGYRLPVTTDADGDGLVNIYDNIVGFGGAGIFIYDHDGDGIPDYRDLDTDGDTQPDIVEGNDFNLNGLRDDDVTLTGLDTDGDGLDNRFDSLNSVTNIKGTSYRMGNLGSFTGDATPGSRTTVQRKFLWQTDRDWRSVGVVLPLQFLQVTATQQDTRVPLTWTIITEEEVASFEVERSIDNINYTVAGVVSRAVQLNVQQLLSYTDDITALTSSVIYYRIKAIGKSGAIKYSNIVVLRNSKQQTKLAVVPNPAYDYALVRFYTEKESMITLRLIDNTGKTVLLQQQKVARGNNTLQLNDLAKFSSGVYTIQLTVNNEVTTQKLIINK